MSEANHPIPSPQPGDSDDVELALETSQRLYLNGDHAEALKWLRRAANAADEAGDDMRQLHLARAAADLTASISSGPQVVTSAPSILPTTKSALPTPTPSRNPQPPSKQPPPSTSVRGSVAPGPTPPSKPSVMPSGAATPQPSTAAAGPPQPLPAKPKPTPSGGSATASAVRTESQPPPKASDSESPPAASKPLAVVNKSKTSDSSVAPAAPAKSSVSPTAASSVPAGAKLNSASVSGFVDVSGAKGTVRVSVRISARDENLYIVRPLEPGQRLPPGSREARLVFDQESS